MRLLFLLLSALLAAAPLRACSVPVFRYALEHWPADPYQAIVFHRGPLDPAQQQILRDLTPDGLAGRLHANLEMRDVDLDADPLPEMLALAEETAKTGLPRLVVRTPKAARIPATVWSGLLDADAVRQLVDSPARREIVTRLGEGQSAVWVLLECGDREKDEAAAKLLDTRLGELAGILSLPRLDPSDIVNGLVSVAQEDLKLEFSVLRLARGDTPEALFIQTLLGTERDLRAAIEPIAVPVFGRGRALYAFVGAGLKRETIDQAASFLIGKCSCQVKELNPGADLLIGADWDALVKAHASPPPDLPTLAELAKSAPVSVTFHGNEAKSESDPPQTPRAVYLAGGIAALLAAAGLFLLRKSPPPPR